MGKGVGTKETQTKWTGSKKGLGTPWSLVATNRQWAEQGIFLHLPPVLSLLKSVPHGHSPPYTNPSEAWRAGGNGMGQEKIDKIAGGERRKKRNSRGMYQENALESFSSSLIFLRRFEVMWLLTPGAHEGCIQNKWQLTWKE